MAHPIVDQGDEDDGLAALGVGHLVDLTHHHRGFFHRVDEGPAHMARLGRKLRQDRVAEGLGRDAGAVRDKEHAAVGHLKVRLRPKLGAGSGIIGASSVESRVSTPTRCAAAPPPPASTRWPPPAARLMIQAHERMCPGGSASGPPPAGQHRFPTIPELSHVIHPSGGHRPCDTV